MHIADLTPDLQAFISWGSTVRSFHSQQPFFVNQFHVILDLSGPHHASTSISYSHDCTTRKLHVFISAKPSLSQDEVKVPKLKLLDCTVATSSVFRSQICLIMALIIVELHTLKVRLGQRPNFTGMQKLDTFYLPTSLVREVAGCENW